MLLFTPFPGISQSPGLEQLIILEADVLKGVKQKLASEQDKAFPVELKQLMDRANEKLTEGPFSVVNKTQVPPSGDKHDYISMGTYWWPDPEKDDGLPYIRKDGEINPEYYDYKDKCVIKAEPWSWVSFNRANYIQSLERIRQTDRN
ncbi:alginate lyase family protein [Cyclobacterium roseum]|uniref:alginate lyase family protein n=1 Tax=Cyclobacterium roseum TaxID=2666137 RepID=UPI001390F994|nr:alginate lyase family protein [Cyclobacterium roseum]